MTPDCVNEDMLEWGSQDMEIVNVKHIRRSTFWGSKLEQSFPHSSGKENDIGAHLSAIMEVTWVSQQIHMYTRVSNEHAPDLKDEEVLTLDAAT